MNSAYGPPTLMLLAVVCAAAPKVALIFVALSPLLVVLWIAGVFSDPEPDPEAVKKLDEWREKMRTHPMFKVTIIPPGEDDGK